MYWPLSVKKFRFAFWDVRAASIIALIKEAALSSKTSVDNYFTRQYILEDKSELHTRRRENLKSHIKNSCLIFRYLFSSNQYVHNSKPFLWNTGLPIGRPDMRVKHWSYGHSFATLLNPRGVATVSHKYSLTVERHVVVAVPSTVHYPANYKIKNIYAGI
jgi:hypothetical protein